MLTNINQVARFELYNLINTFWKEACELYIGSKDNYIEWDSSTTESDRPNSMVTWARCSFLPTPKQSVKTFADFTGVRLYEYNAMLTLQIFVPFTEISAYNVGEAIAVYIRSKFETIKDSCVVCKSPSVMFIGKDMGYFNFNFTSVVTYRDVK